MSRKINKTNYYSKRREQDGLREKLRALRSEQRHVEEEARIERCKSKEAMETLAGFDHETNLQLGLLHQQMKVN